ncbi:hypothetical protein [Pseudofrankia sp. DC12]|uniref:hypothetical protein n=1 Tax=Pseudofrankia sp. DC12 TaxID=683315 RepID=UPI0012FA20F4|nr:hypothetical protein [Pseudofrankia sp. DC12]
MREVFIKVEPAAAMSEDAANALFMAWVWYFLHSRFEWQQRNGLDVRSGKRTALLGVSTGNHLTLVEEPSGWCVASSAGIDLHVAHGIMREAAEKVSHEDFGGTVVYRTEMKTRPWLVGEPSAMLNFIRLMGDQVHILGPRWLSDAVLLDFADDPDHSTGNLFIPPSVITATFFIPGPCESDMSLGLVRSVAEATAAICALACGRIVDCVPPRFPVPPEVATAALARRSSTQALGLARNYVSLDIFQELHQRGGPDSVVRARNAAFSYHAALKQDSVEAAMVFFVTALEALFVPRQNWRKEKVTQRFIGGMQMLCLDAVDELLASPNAEYAFNFRRRGEVRRQRREILELIYDLRSSPVHQGIGPPGFDFMDVTAPESTRAALMSKLAQAAILNFISVPRSFLIGHPMF